MRKYHKLQSMVLLGFLALALVLVVVISAVVGTRYVQAEMDTSEKMAFSFTKAAADYIDGDKVVHYFQTEEKDAYYYEILDYLNAYQANSSILYYYVFVPLEQDLVYIWDANTTEGACELGYHEAYMDGGKEAVKAIFRQNPPEEVSIVNDETYGYIASAYSPIFDSTGNPVAVAAVDISMPNLQKNMAQFLSHVIVAIILVVLLAICLCFFFVKIQIVTPIHKLRNASKSMVDQLENDQSIQISICTGNEIEELFDAFQQMYTDVRNYIRKLSAITAEKERIGAELNVATQIQSSMLPCIFPAFPNREEFDIYATMTPAKEVGGDFYDFFMVDNRHLAVVIADVSGKGVPAALFMVIGKTLIKDHTLPGKDLGAVFTQVNQLLCESNQHGLFITAFEGVLDLVTGEFCFVNAGHEKPMIAPKGKGFSPYTIRPGFVLAGMEGMCYKTGSIMLEPGAKILLYTDGVTEATNTDLALYGADRLRQTVSQVSDKTPKEILSILKADIDTFASNAPQSDDITMLCLEYKTRMTGEEQP